MIKQAVIVARVSTHQQAEKGTSIQTQIEAGRKYAQLHHMTVVEEIIDAVSGTVPIRQRQGGQRLYTYIDNRTTNAVIFSTLDRVARDEDGIEVLTLRKDLRTAGIELHYTDTGPADLSGIGGLVDYFKAIGAAEERKKIAGRNMLGRWQKVLNGRYVASQKTPYGFIKTPTGLVINEAEAHVIRLIYQWYTTGDETKTPCTLRGIADKLTKLGIPTPSENAGLKIKRTNTGWVAFTVRYILTSETYCGVYWFGITQWANGKQTERRRDPISVPISAIVTREVWQAAQERISHNTKMCQRSIARDYLLRGFIKCGQCGGAMIGKAQRDPHDKTKWRTFYRCNKSSWNRPHTQDQPVCNLRYVPAQWLEEETWRFVVETITGDGFEQRIAEAQADEAKITEPLKTELAHINALIKTCKQEADALIKQMTKITSPFMQLAFDQNVKDLEARHHALALQKNELEKRITAASISDADIAAAMRFKDDVLAGLDIAQITDKRTILEVLHLVVTVYPDRKHGDKARIDLNLGDGPISSLEIGTSPPQAPPCSQTQPR